MHLGSYNDFSGTGQNITSLTTLYNMMRAERVKSAEAGKQSSSDETDPEKMTPLQRMAMVVGTKTNLNDMLKKLEDISPEWETKYV